MKVLFVCNNDPYSKGSGLATAIKVTIKELKESGVDVRLMSAINEGHDGPQPDYLLEKFIFPIFQPIIDANCYCFAKADKKTISEAVDWADVIHIEEPFPLQIKAIKEAERKGKGIVSTFHMFTDNIFYNLRMPWWRGGNHFLMSFWKRHIYDHCSDIHCPSGTTKKLLERWRFKARLHTISNGMDIDESYVPSPVSEKAPYKILTIGRFSPEKDQITLLRAMEYSAYSQKIQLHFAGHGNMLGTFKRESDKLLRKGILKYPPIFGFYDAEGLEEISRGAYLYIHGAVVEVEGLSCLEAIREGAVPVVANAKLAATKDFSLCEESLFAPRDPRSLASRIDWWIEHPEIRNEMGRRYAESAKKYGIGNSTRMLKEMYAKAIESVGK